MAPKAAEAEQKAGKSKAEKKPVKAKAEKKPVAKEGGKNKNNKKSVETYKIYIYKVLKQVRERVFLLLLMTFANWCNYVETGGDRGQHRKAFDVVPTHTM
jgi:hypothetical protein